MTSRHPRPGVAHLLIVTLVLGPLQAQAPPKLKILVLEGEGAINNIKQRTAREPIVEVRDENDKPIGGAIVTFTLPNVGPSGVFPNGSRILMVPTNNQGQAVATGLKPAGGQGNFQIRVTASHQGQTASTNINMQNAAGGGGGGGMGPAGWVAILGGAAAAVGAGLYLGLRDSGPPPRTPITINPGDGRIGAQR